VARHVRPGIDPEKAAETSRRLASLAGSALTGKAFLASFGFAAGDLLFDLLSLDLVSFLAISAQLRAAGRRLVGGEHRQPHPGDPRRAGRSRGHAGGHHARFSAPRATVVLAVLGYRIVNYWLPLPPGAIAYLRFRPRRVPRAKGKAKDSLRRRRLADHIPGINFCRTRCDSPECENVFAEHGWAAYPTLTPIVR
jgi:hypothetical protein